MPPPQLTVASRAAADRVRKQRADRSMKRINNVQTITYQGKLLVWKSNRSVVSCKPTSTRGEIRGFSKASRFRMLKFIAGVNWQKVGESVFITLTFPDSVEVKTAAQLTGYRSLFWRKLEDHCGKNIAAIWRVEWKERLSGAHKGRLKPHVHMLAFGVSFIPYETINQWWKDVIGVTTYVRTDIRRLRDAGHTAKYAAKYAAKVESSSLVNASYLDQPVGRQWGYLRKKLIPQFELHMLNLTLNRKTLAVKARALDGRPAMLNPADESFTLLGERTAEIIDALRELGIDDIDLPK